ncbi:Nuclear poly(A) polymerase 3 [Camellia lanceoleosa]|uniref:Nuclear poly(A) polymerase 3 n=1 Tax=Camellia lanceoleosa TaxID=1840588 RepID=A0ACC0G567_9ERIC|nr:Nuclear poly(A) polymerase 3 [Camellia lanceoleosa]
MQFKLDGISIDLPYAQLKVMFVPELSVMHNVDILNPFFLRNIENHWRSLSEFMLTNAFFASPNMEVSSMLSMGSYGIQITAAMC